MAAVAGGSLTRVREWLHALRLELPMARAHHLLASERPDDAQLVLDPKLVLVVARRALGSWVGSTSFWWRLGWAGGGSEGGGSEGSGREGWLARGRTQRAAMSDRAADGSERSGGHPVV